MNADLVKAVFATYVVGVALIRLLDDRESLRLTAMKKIWGRSYGLMLHFLTNIAIPMLFALVFYCRGFVTMSTL
ncbi:hypothetical protein SAMN05660420_02847 [Desulfuromusa kysingii]|uniref:Uncharacterized protein n=1 Tax=Desulfuromusa kysingii TaxID=37625 RepID=A0A1H4D645_9BACT|nr:hypothetical protein [Desulfuromusa kysingii]SEA67970.1 hypothetical protein SAMN05660420_02847 [Desulfuromusa kysingii]